MQAVALIQGNSDEWDNNNPPVDIWGPISVLGPPLMLLALRPGDASLIRLAGFLLASLCFYNIAILLSSLRDWQQPFANARHATVAANDFTWGIVFLRACLPDRSYAIGRCVLFRPISSRQRLESLWWAFRGVVLCFALVNICFLLVIIIHQTVHKSDGGNMEMGGFSLRMGKRRIASLMSSDVFLLVLALVLNSSARRVIQKYLRNWDHKAEAQSAASISQMIGGMKPATAIAFAQSHFRGVSFGHLSVDDFQFARQQPAWRGNEGLPSHSFVTSFGKVDAFVSHTWNDDYQERFASLENWAMRFRERKGREPVIWFDKVPDGFSLPHTLNSMTKVLTAMWTGLSQLG
ncbi:MAG: hypothetical protein SGPRY_012216 [Prymnesium sp.]